MCFLAETLGAVVTREGLLPVCTCSCEPRWIFCEKQRSQWVQVKGRFPVCKRACSVMWAFLPKVLPHWEQSKVWGWGSPWLDTSRGSQVLTLGAAQWLLFTQHMHCCKAKPESSLRPSLALYSSLGLRLSDLQTPSTGSPESSNSAHRPPGVVVCFHFHRPDQPLAWTAFLRAPGFSCFSLVLLRLWLSVYGTLSVVGGRSCLQAARQFHCLCLLLTGNGLPFSVWGTISSFATGDPSAIVAP